MQRLPTRRCKRCPANVFWAQVPGWTSQILFDADPVDSTTAGVHVVLVDGNTCRARQLAAYLDTLGTARKLTRSQALAEVLRLHSLHRPHACSRPVHTTHAAITEEATRG